MKNVSFHVDKVGANVVVTLKKGASRTWLLNARVASLRKVPQVIAAIQEHCRDRGNYETTQAKAAKRPHWYFTLRAPDGEKLGGTGGFSSEAAAEKGIAAVMAAAPHASIPAEYAVQKEPRRKASRARG